MPASAAQSTDPIIVGPLGGLALSALRASSPMLVVRAARWYRDLARLGVDVPLFVVHDLGLLLAAPSELVERGGRPALGPIFERAPALRARVGAYHALLGELAESEVCRRARTLRLSDDLVVVVLARLLGRVASRCPMRSPHAAALPLDPELLRDFDAQLVSFFAAVPRDFDVAFLDALLADRLPVLTLTDALDLDTLRLLGMLGPEASAAGALAHVDLLAALTNPAANDVVSFSLELLPTVLETRRTRSAESHATDGYSGIGNKGSFDSLVLAELAWDDEELARRMLDGEMLYYTRERAPAEARRLHYVFIDASASMRGDRQVFARGLAVALAKKLDLAGEEVWLRFFDSRLYEVQKAKAGHLPIAHLLSFQGERGRHPARVFAQLVTELALLRARERDPVVHLITHSALHIPRSLVQELRAQAHLFGIFILPHGGSLDLDYLDLLESHAVVDHATLASTHARKAAATKIVGEAAERGERLRPSLAPRSRTLEADVPPSLRPSRAPSPPSVR